MAISIHAILFKGDFMNPIELGKFLANLRNEKNLTQEELAEKLFIDKRKISRWECGTSTPEFDMLIKLSEILDVSLYELSICKRLDKEKLSRKTLNKFKSIKDFKKYKLKKKIMIIALILLAIIFAITLTYTIRNSGSVEIYELKSLDENFYIKGNYIKYKDDDMLNIYSLWFKDSSLSLNNNDCTMEIKYKNQRKFKQYSDNSIHSLFSQTNYYNIKSLSKIDTSKPHLLKIMCNQNITGHTGKYISFDFEFEKIYHNKLFNI